METDWEGVRRGVVPCTGWRFVEALNYRAAMTGMPVDDWNLKIGNQTVDVMDWETGEPCRRQLDPFRIEDQVTAFLIERHKPELVPHYAWRLNRVDEFLGEGSVVRRLRERGQWGADGATLWVIMALAGLRFTRMNTATGRWGFDLDEVNARAVEIQNRLDGLLGSTR